MGKRKREDDDDDYIYFCSGLQRNSRDGIGDTSYIYSESRPYKRPRINPNFYHEPVVHYRYVNPYESIHKEIESFITNRSIVVDEIVEVKNSVLEDAYYSKKRQKMEEYRSKIEEKLLFHGTKRSKVDSICRFNFDWRLTGTNKGHKFGQGVCFSPNAKYASNYSDRNSYDKVMIVAKVLIGKVCPGYHDMSIPPSGYDTSQKQDGVVLVKYEDNEFFPAYIIHYHFSKKRNYRRFNYDVHPYRCFSYGVQRSNNSSQIFSNSGSYENLGLVNYWGNDYYYNSQNYTNHSYGYNYSFDYNYSNDRNYFSFENY